MVGDQVSGGRTVCRSVRGVVSRRMGKQRRAAWGADRRRSLLGRSSKQALPSKLPPRKKHSQANSSSLIHLFEPQQAKNFSVKSLSIAINTLLQCITFGKIKYCRLNFRFRKKLHFFVPENEERKLFRWYGIIRGERYTDTESWSTLENTTGSAT